LNDLWTSRNAWIAHFDILGFKQLLENEGGSLTIAVVKSKIDKAIEKLKKDVSNFDTEIDYLFFSDTFVIYSKTKRMNEYPGLISVAKSFINHCIYMKLPVRGAVSFGNVVFGHNNKILMGKAFLESHIYGEDQNWIGLLLTPSACEELEKNDLKPVRHGFTNRDIPMRKCKGSVYAYIFINGSTNFNCPLLSPLSEMMAKAPDDVKIKYENTISFIEKHYVVSKSS